MIQPIFDRILVRPLKAEEKTKTGLLLPEKAKKPKEEGEIVAVGSAVNEALGKDDQLSAGDRILYAPYGDEVDYNGETLLFLKKEDIYAKVN